MNINAWEREQIDRYIRNGGKVTVITLKMFGEIIEAKDAAARKRASKRSIEFHKRRRMKGDGARPVTSRNDDRSLTVGEMEEVKRLWLVEGWSGPQISAHFGLHPKSAYKAINRLGLQGQRGAWAKKRRFDDPDVMMGG